MIPFCLLFLALAAAQQPEVAPIQLERAPGNAQFAGVYHPATGLQPAGSQARFGPELIWNCQVLGNYYSVRGARQEWIDEGVLPQRHAQPVEQINGLSYSYCSGDDQPNGLVSVMRIYEETAACAGPADWPVSTCAYTLTGLPAGDSSGNLLCWTVQIDLAGFECDLAVDPAQQQLFGWSNTFPQDLTQTGPRYATGDGHTWLGSENSFVWFDRHESSRNAAFLGCYWWGGLPLAQFAMGLHAQVPEVFAETARGGAGADDSLKLYALNSFRVGEAPMVEVRAIADGQLVPSTRLWASTERVDMGLQQALGLDAHLLVPRWKLAWDEGADGFHTGPVIPAWAAGRTYYLQAAQLGAAGRPTAFSAHALRVHVP